MKTRTYKTLELLLVAACFCACLAGALLLPVDECPDEGGRLLLTQWIVAHGTLPTGDETEVMIPGWGFSYALRPYLTAIVGALWVKLAALFTDSGRVLLAAARMCSVLAHTLSCVYCLRLGRRLLKKRGSALLFAAFVCFLPQALFLGMYQNNDALSMCAVCMSLYYFAEGFDLGWPVRSCAGLAVAMSLGLLSYYSAYAWLLCVALACVLSVLTDARSEGKGRLIARRAALIALICLALAGWFFIRNAALHDGDFLGIASEQRSRERLAQAGYTMHEYKSFRDRGETVFDLLAYRSGQWITLTLRSFICVMGYMTYPLTLWGYIAYCAVFALAVGLFVPASRDLDRRGRLLFGTMLLATVVTVALSFWQSYARDYEPQGRYVITAAVLLGAMLAWGVDRLPDRPGRSPAAWLTAAWLILCVTAFIHTMPMMLA